VVAGTATVVALTYRSPLDMRGYHRIRLGMTVPEIEAALGVALDQYAAAPGSGHALDASEGAAELERKGLRTRLTGPEDWDYVDPGTGDVVVRVSNHTWTDGNQKIAVRLRDGRVILKSHFKSAAWYERWATTALRSLGL
jgi:hypothetical protein